MSKKEKKYYWLKLKEDFFRDKRIKKLRRIAGGDTFTIIYLKMQLLSLKNEGVIFYEGVEPTLAEELALEIDEDEDNVAVTISYLVKNGLLEELDEDRYLLVDACKAIGFEGSSAERVRRHREAKKQIELQGEEQKTLPCNAEVTQGNAEVTACNDEETKRNTEIDIDLELEKEKELQLYQDAQQEMIAEEAKAPAPRFHLFEEYRRLTGKTPNGIQQPHFIRWVSTFPPEVLQEALNRLEERAPDNPFNYLKSILEDWQAKKLLTLEAVLQQDGKSKGGNKNAITQSNGVLPDDHEQRALQEKLARIAKLQGNRTAYKA